MIVSVKLLVNRWDYCLAQVQYKNQFSALVVSRLFDYICKRIKYNIKIASGLYSQYQTISHLFSLLAFLAENSCFHSNLMHSENLSKNAPSHENKV